MPLSSKHPLYLERIDDWQQLQETWEGERTVKSKRFKYLKPTASMIEDGIAIATDKGSQNYEAYLDRARCPDIVRETVDALMGVIWRKAPTIELPAAMEPLLERASNENESLELFLRRMNEQQFVKGRLGIMADVIDEGERAGQPYLTLYEAETVGNWDAGRLQGIEAQNLNLVVLDESGPERIDDFEWVRKTKWRVLTLVESGSMEIPENEDRDPVGPNEGTVAVENLPEGSGVYVAGVFEDEQGTFDASQLRPPSIRGTTLTKIPFVFANTKDLSSDPDVPPLLALSNAALAIYRGEADYRQALHLLCQDTLVIIGSNDEESETRIGTGAKIEVPQGGDAKFIGIDSSGVPEMRTGLENDYKRADEMSGKLLDTTSREKESGEALQVRVAAKTATLVNIVRTGAAALQAMLRIVAEWMGADPEQVIVTPSLEFSDKDVDGKTVVEFTSSKAMGAPLSWQTIHEYFAERGATTLTFEEEIERIRQEQTDGLDELFGGGSAGSQNEDGPEADEEDGEEEEADAEDEGEGGDA